MSAKRTLFPTLQYNLLDDIWGGKAHWRVFIAKKRCTLFDWVNEHNSPMKPCALKRSAGVVGNSGEKWHVVGQHPWESLQLTVPLSESYLGTNTTSSWEEALLQCAGPREDRNVSLQMENVHSLLVKLSLKAIFPPPSLSRCVWCWLVYLARVFLCLR